MDAIVGKGGAELKDPDDREKAHDARRTPHYSAATPVWLLVTSCICFLKLVFVDGSWNDIVLFNVLREVAQAGLGDHGGYPVMSTKL